jgi:hypothetical protein
LLMDLSYLASLLLNGVSQDFVLGQVFISKLPFFKLGNDQILGPYLF